VNQSVEAGVKTIVKAKMPPEIPEPQSLSTPSAARASVDSGLPAAEPTRSWATIAQKRWIAPVSLLVAVFVWSYWPTLRTLEDLWRNVQDYSHGYIVIPLAIVILWARRDRLPAPSEGLAWPGLVLVALSVAMRYVGARYYLESLDGWSILPWVFGVVWFFFGRAVALWSLPSVIFLAFMVRIPFRAELALSLQLQLISTKLACWGLQILGQPAISDGNLIFLPDLPQPLEVAGVCSGMRIFIGVAALAYAFVAIVRRPWWERVLLVASFIPISLISNATRVVATALLWEHVSGNAAHRFSHDVAGYAMIVYAALLFALVLWYLGKVFREEELVDMSALVRRESD
jgi:exosortase